MEKQFRIFSETCSGTICIGNDYSSSKSERKNGTNYEESTKKKEKKKVIKQDARSLVVVK